MRQQKPVENPFPISATVYSRSTSFVVGLLSFGSLFSLAEMKDIHCIVLHDIAKATDDDGDVAGVMADLLKHLEVCLTIKGLKIVGHELELTSGNYDLRAMTASRFQRT